MRHCRLIRMLCWPFLSPFSASNLFPGGTARFSSRTVECRMRNRVNAVSWMLVGNLRENSPAQIFSVCLHLKLIITLH